VILGEPGAGRRHRCDVGQHELQGAPADEHRSGVDDVLAGRAVVHEPRRLASHGRAQRPHQRFGRVARAPPLVSDALAVEELRAAARRDRLRGRGRDQADGGLGLRQRALAVEHRLQPGAVAQLVE